MACNQHSNEIATLKKYVFKLKKMRIWMIEFLRKFENRRIKIVRVNSILITRSINLQLFTLILCGFVVRCDLRRFSVLSPFTEMSMIPHKTYLLYHIRYQSFRIYQPNKQVYAGRIQTQIQYSCKSL